MMTVAAAAMAMAKDLAPFAPWPEWAYTLAWLGALAAVVMGVAWLVKADQRDQQRKRERERVGTHGVLGQARRMHGRILQMCPRCRTMQLEDPVHLGWVGPHHCPPEGQSLADLRRRRGDLP